MKHCSAHSYHTLEPINQTIWRHNAPQNRDTLSQLVHCLIQTTLLIISTARLLLQKICRFFVLRPHPTISCIASIWRAVLWLSLARARKLCMIQSCLHRSVIQTTTTFKSLDRAFIGGLYWAIQRSVRRICCCRVSEDCEVENYTNVTIESTCWEFTGQRTANLSPGQVITESLDLELYLWEIYFLAK